MSSIFFLEFSNYLLPVYEKVIRGSIFFLLVIKVSLLKAFPRNPLDRQLLQSINNNFASYFYIIVSVVPVLEFPKYC